MTATNHKVAFIGSGQMATALAVGLLKQFAKTNQIVGSDPSEPARQRFTESTGCSAVTATPNAVKDATIVFLAVKPQYLSAVCEEVSPLLDDGKLVVSIAPGFDYAHLRTMLGGHERIVRVMPNTPCLIGAGVCAIAGEAAPADVSLVQEMLEPIATTVVVSENQMDAVTGLSGSGPAFVYQIIEALSDGGVRTGLPRATATLLAAQTVLGAAQMVLETGDHPGTLKDAVASPGGTTIAGLHALERGGLRGALMDAVEAAANRSRELGG